MMLNLPKLGVMRSLGWPWCHSRERRGRGKFGIFMGRAQGLFRMVAALLPWGSEFGISEKTLKLEYLRETKPAVSSMGVFPS